jgi:ABC-type amino acid transport system permease subunit
MAGSTVLMFVVVLLLLVTALVGMLGYPEVSNVAKTILKTFFYFFLVIFLALIFFKLYLVLPFGPPP